jgi:outer membrane protein insertion porin family
MVEKILFRLGSIVSLSILFAYNTLAQNPIVTSPVKLDIDYLHPANYIIEEIQITGNKSLASEALLAISSLSVGDTIQIPGTAITDAIQKLWHEKIIKNVSVYASKIIENRITLVIDVVESPRLSTYTFAGVAKREEKKLSDQLNLVRGKIITSKLVNTLKNTIEKDFLEQGYRDVAVSIDTMLDPADSNYNQLKISIHKGEKFKINKIIIHGNNNLSSPLLKAYLEYFQEKPRFTLIKDVLYNICTLKPIRKGGILWNKPSVEQVMVYLKKHFILFPSKFIEQKYLSDKQRLIQYYQTKGYKDAKIVRDKVYKVAEGWINIGLDIEEGQKYYIRNISWVGNHIYDATTLNKILNIRPGTVYNSSLLQERLMFNPADKDISSLYMDDGYLFFNVEPVEIAVEDNKVDLELRVHEGTQATINAVDIRGNIYTHEQVIRRELKTLPGDKFSRAKVIRSQRELSMLNVFDPSKMGITPLPNPENNTVDLRYKVKEAPNFNVKAGATLSSQGKPSFYVDLGTNNFSLGNALRGKMPIGDVQSLYIKAQFYGIKHQDFTLQFIEPWLTGQRPTSLSLSISKSFQQYEGKKDESSKFDSNLNYNPNRKIKTQGSLGSFGIRGALGKRLTWPDDYFSFKTGIGYRVYNYENYDVLDDKNYLNGTTHDFALDFTLERNSLDQPTYPMHGSLVNLQLKLTPPYSLFLQQNASKVDLREKLKRKEYHQTMLDIGLFYNLFGDWVLNLFANSGFLGSYSPKHPIGIFERFNMGGKGLVDFSLVGNEGVSLRGYPESHIEGGVLFDKFGLELRHPIIKSTMMFVYGLVFAEAGNTWANYSDWKLTDLKKSVGIGLRFHLPIIGSLGLDWGHGFDRVGTDKLELHWTLGAGSR